MNKKVFGVVSHIPGWLTKHEGQFLEKAVFSLRRNTGTIVEIGSFLGKSTLWLTQSGETVYAIDPHKGEFSGGKTKPTLPEFSNNLKKAGVYSLVKPIVKTSKEAATEWRLQVKFLFIDGLHDFDHALEDFSLWRPFVRKGGVIAMHDAFCGWTGAGDVAMRHIIYNPDFEEIGVIGSIVYGKIGSGSFLSRIRKLFNQIVIELCNSIYRSSWVPKWIQFILVHRFLRVLLVNRFTSFG